MLPCTISQICIYGFHSKSQSTLHAYMLILPEKKSQRSVLLTFCSSQASLVWVHIKFPWQVNKATAPLPLQLWRQQSKDTTVSITLGQRQILRLRNFLVKVRHDTADKSDWRSTLLFLAIKYATLCRDFDIFSWKAKTFPTIKLHCVIFSIVCLCERWKGCWIAHGVQNLKSSHRLSQKVTAIKALKHRQDLRNSCLGSDDWWYESGACGSIQRSQRCHIWYSACSLGVFFNIWEQQDISGRSGHLKGSRPFDLCLTGCSLISLH